MSEREAGWLVEDFVPQIGRPAARGEGVAGRWRAAERAVGSQHARLARTPRLWRRFCGAQGGVGACTLANTGHTQANQRSGRGVTNCRKYAAAVASASGLWPGLTIARSADSGFRGPRAPWAHCRRLWKTRGGELCKGGAGRPAAAAAARFFGVAGGIGSGLIASQP